MRWEDDEVRMTSLKTSEDTRALETRSVHGGYFPLFFFILFLFSFFLFFSVFSLILSSFFLVFFLFLFLFVGGSKNLIFWSQLRYGFS